MNYGYYYEILYRTPNGKYFIYGKGRSNSSWAESLGGGARTGGQDIKPLTREEAIDWLETHNFVEELKQEFGNDIEDA